LLPLASCSVPGMQAAPDPFACRSDLAKTIAAQAGKGQLVSTRSLNAVFRRLDAQSRVDVRQTDCEVDAVSLRYLKPQRTQFVAQLNTGDSRYWRVAWDPRQTQIGNRLGYVGQVMPAPWVGVGVTAHRMLLPDAWGDMSGSQLAAPTFYLVRPPQLPVRDLTLRTSTEGRQRTFVEQWRGLFYRCSFGASCPAPNTDPQLFARYTAVLRVDMTSGLPVSMSTVAQQRESDHGRFAYGGIQPVAQAVFHYRGDFSIGFVKG